MSKTPIEVKDIREGDLIRFEYDRPDYGGHLKAVEYQASDDQEQYSVKAGALYLLERPVSKLWHAAKAGEVWALTVDGVEKAFTLHGDPYRTGNLHDIEQTDRHITAGRRLWPEN